VGVGGLGFRVWIQGLGFQGWGSGFGPWGLEGVRVWGEQKQKKQILIIINLK
jgi:hypothetical protein